MKTHNPVSYWKAATDIFNWLSQHQIRQQHIVARREGPFISFTLQHPVRKDLPVRCLLPLEDSFRIQGIGLRVVHRDHSEVLLQVYDHGGIWDPVDENVPGDHYATTHFACLAAVIFAETKDRSLLEKISDALAFHERTSSEEYSFDNWGYHWDFQNFALLEAYRLLRDHLSDSEKKRWMKAIRRNRENLDNPLTNWIAMRSCVALLRHDLFRQPWDRWRWRLRLNRVFRARYRDGYFDEFRGMDKPIQYHAYTLALLHRLYLLRPRKKLKDAILSGTRYLISLTDPEGCFNYVGRGQEQIFGYASALYILEAAQILDPDSAGHFAEVAKHIWRYLLSFKRNGHFPLVLNQRQDQERYGWYDYHHLTVYNAFLGLWLAFAQRLHDMERPGTVKSAEPFRPVVFYTRPTRTAVLSNGFIFSAFRCGKSRYYTEPGISPLHLWLKKAGWVFSCPGGPTERQYGKVFGGEYFKMNFFSPLVKPSGGDWIIPVGRECRILDIGADRVRMTMDYGPFRLFRSVRLDDTVFVIEDHFETLRNTQLEKFRYVNIPVVIDKYKIDCPRINELHLIGSEGVVRVFVTSRDFKEKHFEKFEEIRSAKGRVTVMGFQESPFPCRKKETREIRMVISELGHTVRKMNRIFHPNEPV
ncbi:hypothetical protein JW906_07715 [bacterium]|nr:hypothetical protein [bacterium]